MVMGEVEPLMGLGTEFQGADDHARADGKYRLGLEFLGAPRNEGYHVKGFPQACIRVAADHAMFGGAAHGREHPVDIVIFHRHIMGNAAVLKKMDVGHFVHNPGHVVDILKHGLARLTRFQIDNSQRRAAGTAMDAIHPQMHIVSAIAAVKIKLRRRTAHHLRYQFPGE
jgi:hypothetical protein